MTVNTRTRNLTNTSGGNICTAKLKNHDQIENYKNLEVGGTAELRSVKQSSSSYQKLSVEFMLSYIWLLLFSFQIRKRTVEYIEKERS